MLLDSQSRWLTYAGAPLSDFRPFALGFTCNRADRLILGAETLSPSNSVETFPWNYLFVGSL